MAGYEFAAIREVSSPLQLVLHTTMTFPRYERLVLSLGPQSPVVLVEARCDERLVGVGLAALGEVNAEAKVLSIFVDAQHRGRGVGTHLLAHLEQELVARSATSAKLSYQTGQPATDALECILRKQNWSEPETALIVCTARGTPESFKNIFLLQNRVPEGFSIFRWVDLPQAELEAIRKKQDREAWYPDFVSPFGDGQLIEPHSSIGLRHTASGEIAGWMINHKIGPRTVRFSSLFVSPPYRYANLGLFLIIHSIKQLGDFGVADFGMWYFRPDNPVPRRFAERTMKPHLTAYNQIKHSRKILDSEHFAIYESGSDPSTNSPTELSTS